MNSPKNRRTSGQASVSAPVSAPDWIDSFERSADSLEADVRGMIRENPALVFAGALGLGLAGSFLMKALRPPKRGGVAKRVPTGEIRESLSPILDEFRENFDRVAFDGVNSVRHQITTGFVESLETRPFGTVAACLAVGYGLAGLNREQLTRGLLHTLKLAAVKQISSTDQKPKGETHANDQSNAH